MEFCEYCLEDDVGVRNDRRELFDLKLFSKISFAKIRNLRILFAVVLVILGAFDYSFISCAAPVQKEYTFSLSNVGMIPFGYDGVETDKTTNRYSDYIEIDDVFRSSTFSCSLKGTSTSQYLHSDTTSLLLTFYGSDKVKISNRKVSGTVSYAGTSGNYTFTSVFDFPFDPPSDAFYFRVSTRHLGDDTDFVSFSTPISCSLIYEIEGSSFNWTMAKNIVYPLDLSLYRSEFDGNSFFYSGSNEISSFLPVTVSAFGENPGYYDVDFTVDLQWDSSRFSGSSYFLKDSFSRFCVRYPSCYVTGLPDGLSYSITSSRSPRAVAYEASKDAGVTNPIVTNNGNATYKLHVYGTAYLSGDFSFNFYAPVIFELQNFIYMSSSLAGIVYTTPFKAVSGSGTFYRSTSGSVSEAEALEKIDQTLKTQHDEEVSESQAAGSELGSTMSDVTGTLSTIEILKLPWTMLTDLFNALSSDGETTLTFPSFSLMGHTLWPEYSFSLTDLDSNFDILFRSVRLVSGVMLCLAFAGYIRGFFTKVFGNSEEEGV